MPAVRRFVGLLGVLGGTGVILGIAIAPLGAFAAAGLTALMVLGLIVRVGIRDAPRLMVPAEIVDSEKTDSAGRYRFTGSPTLMCIPMAPSMNNARPIEAGRVTRGAACPASIRPARLTFAAPTAYIVFSESPYSSNSSFMFVALPPR